MSIDKIGMILSDVRYEIPKDSKQLLLEAMAEYLIEQHEEKCEHIEHESQCKCVECKEQCDPVIGVDQVWRWNHTGGTFKVVEVNIDDKCKGVSLVHCINDSSEEFKEMWSYIQERAELVTMDNIREGEWVENNGTKFEVLENIDGSKVINYNGDRVTIPNTALITCLPPTAQPKQDRIECDMNEGLYQKNMSKLAESTCKNKHDVNCVLDEILFNLQIMNIKDERVYNLVKSKKLIGEQSKLYTQEELDKIRKECYEVDYAFGYDAGYKIGFNDAKKEGYIEGINKGNEIINQQRKLIETYKTQITSLNDSILKWKQKNQDKHKKLEKLTKIIND